jgi:hypothetical protein
MSVKLRFKKTEINNEGVYLEQLFTGKTSKGCASGRIFNSEGRITV